MFKKKKVTGGTELKFWKCRDVKHPTMAYCQIDNLDEFDYGVGTAGIDMFVPNALSLDELKRLNAVSIDKWMYNISKQHLVLEPNCRMIIPSGLKVNIPEGHVLIAFNKSGVASKKGLILGACVIDEDYMGEILINVINTDNKNAIISAGDKLTQFVLLKLPKVKVKIMKTEDELFNGKITNRLDGGFGSSCK